MSLSLFFFTFLNVWWIMLFFILPFGVRPAINHSPLDYAAAPHPHQWKKLLLINTAISVVVTLIIAVIVKSGVFSLGDIS